MKDFLDYSTEKPKKKKEDYSSGEFTFNIYKKFIYAECLTNNGVLIYKDFHNRQVYKKNPYIYKLNKYILSSTKLILISVVGAPLEQIKTR